MILKAFSIFDVKSEVYARPFFMVANGEAVRAFSDLANDAATTVGKHPGDFKLVLIGSFDDAKGELLTCPPVTLGFAEDYVNLRGVPVGVTPLKKVENNG